MYINWNGNIGHRKKDPFSDCLMKLIKMKGFEIKLFKPVSFSSGPFV
jgi:hypothetical protein